MRSPHRQTRGNRCDAIGASKSPQEQRFTVTLGFTTAAKSHRSETAGAGKALWEGILSTSLTPLERSYLCRSGIVGASQVSTRAAAPSSVATTIREKILQALNGPSRFIRGTINANKKCCPIINDISDSTKSTSLPKEFVLTKC